MFLGTSAFIVTVFLIVVVLTFCVVCKRRVVYTTRAEAVPLEEVHLDAIADDGLNFNDYWIIPMLDIACIKVTISFELLSIIMGQFH